MKSIEDKEAFLLVSRLRLCASNPSPSKDRCYEKCINQRGEFDPDCMEKLLNQAADAIEALVQANKIVFNINSYMAAAYSGKIPNKLKGYTFRYEEDQ